LKELKVMDKELKNPVLERMYQSLLNSSLRSNEIHKNFGELYAALKYSLIHPKDKILLPISGETSFFDFISIESRRNDKYIIIKKIPIKIAPRGAATSITSLLGCLYFNELHPMFPLVKSIINNCPRSNKVIHQLKNNLVGKELRRSISKFYKTIKFTCNEENLYDYIKPIFKDITIARKFWQFILPVVDIEKTKSKIEIGMVDITGEVNFRKFNPLTVTITIPKRPNENVTAILTNKKEKIN
jgi:hypothetical protein